MANLGIKVETVLKKFYDVRQDQNIRGLYEVREKENPDGALLWYFFSSNNATYHSSGNDCVIRDINQTNSAYIDRLRMAFDKAKRKNKKIFWLVLVFGDGIGLAPEGYDWLASVELCVSLDDITASLSMRNYPVGRGRQGYFAPCCVRKEQDVYFNTTFMSCKDEEGNFTSKYMDTYFQIYDNRPYRDIVREVVYETPDADRDTPEDEPKPYAARLTGAENILFYGVPGAGKSHEIKTKYCSDPDFMERVVFHPDYMYSDFVGQILPKVEKDKENVELKYEFTPGPFTEILKKAEEDPAHYYYLVIEELNRGNAPAIFGEVFQLLDRKEADEFPAGEVGESEYGIYNCDVAKEVYQDKEHEVRIPSNLYILATMNTADQNVFTLDTAFQRRWTMRPIKNRFDQSEHAKDMIAGTKINWGAFATVINEMALETNMDLASSEDKRLGVYFVKKRGLAADRFSEKVLKYLWDDAFKMDRTAVFLEKYRALEDVVTAYESAAGDKLEAVLRDNVYGEMLLRMQPDHAQDSAD